MTSRIQLRGSRKRSSGQSLAEFAIVFPVLMLILGGIIQFGVIFWAQNTLTQVVRDTGRWAATQQICDTGVARTAILATANDIAGQSSLIGYTAGEFTLGNTTITWPVQPPPHDTDPCPPNDNQDVRYVTISMTHTAPVFFPFVPGNGQVSSSTDFRMEPKPQ
jgi:Flp pilus assembly protein TadG